MHLKSCYMFQELSQDQAEKFSKIMEEVQYRSEESVFREGQEALHFFILLQGAIVMFMEVEGIEIPLCILQNAGDCFGTAALALPHVYSISAKSKTDSILASINREKFEALVSKDPDLGLVLMRNIARHLIERLNESRQELKVHFKSLFRLSQFIH